MEIKYSAPTNLNRAPYGTIWQHDDIDNTYIWVQVSKDEDQPEWKSLSNMLTVIWNPLTKNKSILAATCRMHMVTRDTDFNSDIGLDAYKKELISYIKLLKDTAADL